MTEGTGWGSGRVGRENQAVRERDHRMPEIDLDAEKVCVRIKLERE